MFIENLSWPKPFLSIFHQFNNSTGIQHDAKNNLKGSHNPTPFGIFIVIVFNIYISVYEVFVLSLKACCDVSFINTPKDNSVIIWCDVCFLEPVVSSPRRISASNLDCHLWCEPRGHYETKYFCQSIQCIG